MGGEGENMSEQPTYWKHKETGAVCKNSGGGAYRDLMTNICYLWNTCEPEAFTSLPTPQVGEKWTHTDGNSVVVLATTQVGISVKGVKNESDTVFSSWDIPTDDFMLNYHRAEDAPKEETQPMFEPRYYRHNTTGAIEKVITQERANALENNTDWKRFYYTFQEEPQEAVVEMEDDVPLYIAAQVMLREATRAVDRLNVEMREITEERDALNTAIKEREDEHARCVECIRAAKRMLHA